MYLAVSLGIYVLCSFVSESQVALASPLVPHYIRRNNPGFFPLPYNPYRYDNPYVLRSPGFGKRSLSDLAIDPESRVVSLPVRRSPWARMDSYMVYDPYRTQTYKPQWRRAGRRGKRGLPARRSSFGSPGRHSDMIQTPDVYGNSIVPTWSRGFYTYVVPDPDVVIYQIDDDDDFEGEEADDAGSEWAYGGIADENY